ncbi:MAG TPA: chemotaxis protein CheX [Opitutaceae bacterium]|nr:chemotaxis protein CheX [Opitutaceae bacterium]
MNAEASPALEFTPENALGILIGHVCRYFETLGGARPELGEASLELRPPERLARTGYMAVSGAAEGWIALSLPDPLLHRILDLLGEPQRDAAALLDLVAEMAGVITSNARAECGDRLRVAPPFALSSADPEPPLRQPSCAFKLPFRWERHDAFLLIALLPPPTTP